MSQVVLSSSKVATATWSDPRLLHIPAICAAASAAFLLLQLTFSTSTSKRLLAKLRARGVSEVLESDALLEPIASSHPTGYFFNLCSHIDKHSGGLILTWKILRLLSCVVLTTLSIVAIASSTTEAKHPESLHSPVDAKWLEVSLSIFYAYTTLLAAFTLTLGPHGQAISNSHLTVLLLVALGIYTWRDLLPLATFELSPADSALGWLTWTRVGVLACAAVVVPLFIPREYVPLDPKDPSTPSPEQTASLISLITYSFLDRLVWVAYRLPKLDYDQLPPLADYDRAAHLKQRGFDQLDPLRRTKHRHLFWGFVEIFWKEYCAMAVTAAIKALMEFSGPLGIRFLLKYLENPSEPGYVRPWVWILWLFLGPVLGSLAMQWFVFVSTRMLVHVEGILTQLLFEHSLRIRMVGGVTGGTPDKIQGTDMPGDETMNERTLAAGSENNTTQTSEGGASHTGERNEPQTPAKSTTSTSDKKQAKAKTHQGDDKNSNLVGKINNLMSTDLKNIGEGRDFVFFLIYAPVQLVGSIILLYWILGWSSVVGMVFMLLTFPIPGKFAQLVNKVQIERMKKTDARVQSITETMSVIRMIKLFGWEKKIQSQIEEKREAELQWYRKREVLGLINNDINHILPAIVMIITFASHTLLFKQPLTASTVFSSISVFELLRNQFFYVFGQVTVIIQAKVSLDRTNDFLDNTELLDIYTQSSNSNVTQPSTSSPGAIGFCNATFTWARQEPGTPARSKRNFRLRIEHEVLFQRGKINMIVGPTGCGKTSLLMALLGEMHFVPSEPNSWFSLPRGGGVAYAAQEAWIQNETIRDNILFGAEYDEERYSKVIMQCALDKDLALFDAGDLTEVGEKGMTLSGGQKARVSLARAIYSKAEIIILDDVLSALDIHTSRLVVDNCFRGELIAGRTVLIVTHNIAMVGEVAGFVVSLGIDGRVISQGHIDDVIRSNPRLKAEVEKDQELERKAADTVDEIDSAKEEGPGFTRKSGGKLMVAEEIAEGHIGWPTLRPFLLSLGGLWFWVMYMGGFALTNTTLVVQGYWLGVWARAYNADPAHVDVPFYLVVYVLLCVGGVVLYSGAFLIHVFGSVRAARRIHNRLVISILGAPLRWQDSTPVGRVIARFTQDMHSVDGALPLQLERLVNITINLILCFMAVILLSPQFTLPGAAILGIGVLIGQIYMVSQLSVKREMSNARSPLFSHFGAALVGITSIRAYGAEDQFRKEALKRVDKYTRAARTFYNLNRWICLRMDVLGGLFAAALAAYLTFIRTSVDASDTGFSLNRAVALSGGILWWVRFLNEFEVQGNSLERIQRYVEVEQEPRAVPEKVPPAYWPSSGNIIVENLTARYSEEGPDVLRGLSFEIKTGERIGVVGRTGSGKSTLALAILRMIPIEGNIYFDGIPTHAINLDALRSNITIIPQQPELISGTVRQNLDPFDEHDDVFLNSALRSAGLSSTQSEGDGGYIGLDSGVSAGGGNFSLGQRQILALARAIARRSKVLILDEATAAIDYGTDTAIQTSIRTELNNKTWIIVAHRLQTICDADKVMVLDAGKIIEFDSPATLLQKDGGAFKSLVDESGDRDALYAMAKAQR